MFKTPFHLHVILADNMIYRGAPGKKIMITKSKELE